MLDLSLDEGCFLFNMGLAIQKLTIEGFKSIRKLEDFELRPLNVLIGANGAGKSNFIGFFRLLRELIDQRLQFTIAKEGGGDACLYLGPKVTKQVFGRLQFGKTEYQIALEPTSDNRLAFADESTAFAAAFGEETQESLGSGHFEARLKTLKDEPGRTSKHGARDNVFVAISNWVTYHFHDTSMEAGVRRTGPINDNEFLRPKAENLAALLYRLRKTDPTYYEKIRDVVRLAAPFFYDFKLRPVPVNPEQIQLEWLQRESVYPFTASQLSDGTLRFICLATALLQPLPPSTMLFDEPELGLHPYALTLLAGLFQQAAIASSHQLIISTQSALLLDEFTPEDVIVVERVEGESTFRRLESKQLSEWMSEYSLGELWQKNVLGGRPRSEPPSAPPVDPLKQ